MCMVCTVLYNVHGGRVGIDVYGYAVFILIKTAAAVGGGCKEEGEDFREGKQDLLYLGVHVEGEFSSG